MNGPTNGGTLDEHATVGAYVSDALEPDERIEFEQHLTDCASCAQEVADLGEALAELSLVTEVAPPPELRAAVMAAVAAEPQLPPLTSQPAYPRHADSGSLSGTSIENAAEHTSLASVTTLQARGRRTRRVLTGLLAAAVAAVVALGVGVVVLRQQVADQRQQVASQQQAAAQRAQLLAAPDARIYAVRMQNGAQASYVVSKSQNRALFVGADVAALPADRVYQLWTTPDTKQFRSAGTFRGTGEQQVPITGNVGNAVALAITVEPSNGGAGSTSPTVIPNVQPFALAQLQG